MNKLEDVLKKAFKPGTPTGKLSFGLLFLVLGIFFAIFGFWKTLVIAVLTCIGVFIGSEETLGKATGKVIDKVYPPKNQKIVYTQEDLEKVKKAAELKNEEEKEQEN
jgi:uncharacterized membrane protein